MIPVTSIRSLEQKKQHFLGPEEQASVGYEQIMQKQFS